MSTVRDAIRSADETIARVRASLVERGLDVDALPENPTLDTLGAWYIAEELDAHAASLTPKQAKPRKRSATAKLLLPPAARMGAA